ncbi:MAG: precorrin-6A reductase [Solirubrobacterales bacterium]
MILVLGGTVEARQTAAALREARRDYLISVATGTGLAQMEAESPERLRCGQLSESSLKALIGSKAIDTVLDCTHPFAEVISQTAISVCRNLGVRYRRLERAKGIFSPWPGLIRAEGVEAAAAELISCSGTILLAIGVNELTRFTAVRSPNRRLLARVLPAADSLAKCTEAGFAPGDIIAVHGVRSIEFNLALIREYGISVLVTKESGESGGTGTKLEAARMAGITAVLIERPVIAYPDAVQSVEELLAGI